MSPQASPPPTLWYTGFFALAAKSFPAALRKPIVLYGPPSRSEPGSGPLQRGGGVSIKTNQRAEQGLGDDDWLIGHEPSGVWSLPPPAP